MHLLPRRRALLATLVAGALCVVAVDARASTPSVSSAQQNLATARAAAAQAATSLGAARQQLSGAQQQLAQTQARVASLNAAVSADTARVQALDAAVTSDKAALAAYLRGVYKAGGGEAAIIYVLASTTLNDAMQRLAEMDRVNQAGTRMLSRIGSEQAQAAAALAEATTARAQAQVAQQQAFTAEAVVSVQAEQLQAAAAAARAQVTTAQSQYNTAVSAAAAAAAASAAAAAAAAATAAAASSPAAPVYQPVGAPSFGVDTNLTVPSGETAAKLDRFLSGSALAGLGQSFMNAERSFHVSARYFVAHAILESSWGTSAIAHDKHNLFGFGADDANPYGDAKSFPSFDACIQYVAQFVARNYLSASGAFYHGPTLRGMNVDYASDPGWANKIARIANTVPD